MPRLLFIESDCFRAESVAKQIQINLGIISEIVTSLDAAQKKISRDKSRYLAFILNADLCQDQLVPISNLPTVVITGRSIVSPQKIAFATNVLDYVPDYEGYHLDYISQLIKRLLVAERQAILLVDDEKVTLNLMRKLLANKGYSILTAKNGQETLRALENTLNIRLLIIDGDICERNNFDILKTIRRIHQKNQLAIVALNESSKEYQRIMLLRNGTNDCITKPFRIEEFHARIMLNLQLVEVLRELTEHSNQDFLTQLYNRRHFFDTGSKLYAHYKRGSLDLTLAMLDIDYLKTINDTHGHLIGDKAITAVAEVLRSNLRATDVLARFGGEEFCVLCTNVKSRETENLFERIREKVQAQPLLTPTGTIGCSISIGVTSNPGNFLEDMIHSADLLLYQAKEQGRNRIIVE